MMSFVVMGVFRFLTRDQTDLDTLSDDLAGVARSTMQPSHVSLWLRPEATDAEEVHD